MFQEYSPKEDQLMSFGADSRHALLAARAALLAETELEGKVRKVPRGASEAPGPYFLHVEAVAKTLERHGYDTEVVAAGYMHDHVEDLPERWTVERIAAELSPRTAELVSWVTQHDKKLSWEERNEIYATRLRSAPPEAMAISAADKLSNLTDLVRWMEKGYSVDQILKRGWEQNSEKMHELRGIFEGRVAPALLAELDAVLARFDELGRPKE